MAEQNKKARRRGGRTNGRQGGYVPKSPAVCIVVHDPSGRPMPDKDADAIVNTIHEIAVSRGYIISFTRT